LLSKISLNFQIACDSCEVLCFVIAIVEEIVRLGVRVVVVQVLDGLFRFVVLLRKALRNGRLGVDISGWDVETLIQEDVSPQVETSLSEGESQVFVASEREE
jgi:hypothetical protein